MSKKQDTIIEYSIADEFAQSFIDYAQYVNTERAIPNILDGCKNVHRRILYSTLIEGLTNDKAPKKSAKIVGRALASFHPHGDTAVYSAMVRLATPWEMRYPLMDFQGNLGSRDGDGAAAMRYCLEGQSLISTDRGLIKVEDIVKNSKLESTTDINLKVQSKGNIINSASQFFNSGTHETKKIITKYGYEIEGTDNHPLMILSNVEGVPTLVWKLIEDIKTGDLLVLNTNSLIESNKDMVSLSEAAFLGLMISEGYVSQNQKYKRVGFSNTDFELVKIVEDFFKSKELKVCSNTRIGTNQKIKELSVHDSEYYESFINQYNFDFGSQAKVVPEVILQSSHLIQKEFLKFLFEGDGSVQLPSVKNNGSISYSSTSKKMLNQIQTILLQFGIISCLYADRSAYRLVIANSESIINFHKQINFYSERKKTALESIVKLKRNNASTSGYNHPKIIGDFIRENATANKSYLQKNSLLKINSFIEKEDVLKKSLSKVDYEIVKELFSDSIYLPVTTIVACQEKVVYSIKVDSSCHSFIANGVINHNTESKLSKAGMYMLQELKKGVVPMVQNFSEDELEPEVLPSLFPNLLVNPNQGIGVAQACSFAPHNLNEVIKVVKAQMKNPKITTKEILELMPGPDFPTGCTLVNSPDLVDIYETGRGKMVLRSTYTIEKINKKEVIVVSEIPYGVIKEKLIEQILTYIPHKDNPRAQSTQIQGLKSVTDLSNRLGIRIEIEVDKDARADVVLSQLFKRTKLQDNFNINQNVLIGKQPSSVNFKQMVQHYIDHQLSNLKTVLHYDLNKVCHRINLIEGFLIALENIDEVIKVIKESKSASIAVANLTKKYKLSCGQAEAIVDMKLRRLTGLEHIALETELKELKAEESSIQNILNNKNVLHSELEKKLDEMVSTIGDERRTIISFLPQYDRMIIPIESKAPKEVVVVLSESGLVKAIPFETFKIEGRNSTSIKTLDHAIKDVTHTTTAEEIACFTSFGKSYKAKVSDIPEGTNSSKGIYLSSLLSLEEGETVLALTSVGKFSRDGFVISVTKQGFIKKANLDIFKGLRCRRTGSQAIKLRPEDEIKEVIFASDDEELLICSKLGYGIRFALKDIMPTGRNTFGIKAMSLREGDEVVAATNIPEVEQTHIIIGTQKGRVKRIPLIDIRAQKRGGLGVKVMCYGELSDIISGVVYATPSENILVAGTLTVACKSVANINITSPQSQGRILVEDSDIKRILRIPVR